MIYPERPTAPRMHLSDWVDSPTHLAPLEQQLTNVFSPISVNSAPDQDVVGNQKEIWPQVIDKAMAQIIGAQPPMPVQTGRLSLPELIAMLRCGFLISVPLLRHPFGSQGN
jgi:hypothetical protein